MQQNQNNNTLNRPINYANAVQSSKKHYPTKKQAIILNGIDGILSEEYVLAIGEIVGPQNIIFFSKKARNKIHIYLNNEETANKLINEHKYIILHEQKIQIRPYHNTNKRLIISNVEPFIPDELIALELTKIGLKLTSEIDWLRAGMKQNGYQHCRGFRRHVFIENNEDITIPEAIIFNFENEEFKIFLTDENHYCSFCKKHGHLVEKCKFRNPTQQPNVNEMQFSQANQNLAEINQTQNTTTTELDDLPILTPAIETLPQTQSLQMETPETKSTDTSTKRPAASISSNGSQDSLNNTPRDEITTTVPNNKQQNTANTKRNKKHKRSISPCTPIEEWLEPARELFKSKNSSLSYDQFINFMEQSHKNPDTLALARQYTTNINGLLSFMVDIQEFTSNRSAKIRITKITNKIQEQLDDEAEHSDSQSE